MAEIVYMPKLSDTMTEGVVASWSKKVGEPVEAGEILAEIETDKATMEFESFYDGVLLHIGVETGSKAPINSVLAIIGEKDEDVKAILASESKKTPEVEPVETPKKEVAKEIVEPKPIKVEHVKTPQPKAEPQASVSISGDRIFASPLAKKLASEQGIDLSKVKGTGNNGRIIKDDVENYSSNQPVSTEEVKINTSHTNDESFEDVQNSQMRKAIARRLKESKFSAPHYYLSVEFEMDNAIAFRQQYNSLPDTKISFNDIIVKACAIALREHPRVNSQWFEEKMRLNHHVHIGVAVGVSDGLVVPVIKFADNKSITEIGSLVKNYANKAREKKLTPDEMQGSTFTISNLGMFGIQEFTSIINQPNSAILSVGSIIKKPIVKDDKIIIGNTIKLTLACDHRTVDGVTGSLFLETLKGYVENPVTMLV